MELYFWDSIKSALQSIGDYFKYLFSWDRELLEEETPCTLENAKDNNKTLNDALRAFAEVAEEFAKVSKAFGILTKDLFVSEKTIKPRMKFAPCLKLERYYNYIPVAKRNMPYQRRNY